MSGARRMLRRFAPLAGGAMLFGGQAFPGCDPETRSVVTAAGASAVTEIIVGAIQLLFATLGLAQENAGNQIALLLFSVLG